MKLYPSDTKRLVLRLGEAVHPGGKLPRADRNLFARLESTATHLFAAFATAYGIEHLIGSESAPTRDPLWQVATGGAICMAVVLFLKLVFFRLPSYSKTALTLRWLPAPGAMIIEWIRGAMFRLILWALPLAFVIAYCQSGFANIPRLLGETLLIWVMLWASLGCATSRWAARLRLDILWLTALAAYVLLAGMYWLMKWQNHSLPSWLIETVTFLSWLFPPTWVMQDRWEGVGGMMALGCVILGGWQWWSWPRVYGPILNWPLDVAAGDEPAPNRREGRSENLTVGSSQPHGKELAEAGELIKPLQMKRTWWLERWVQLFLTPKDRQLAAVLMTPPSPLEAFTWHLAIVGCMLCLILAAAAPHFWPSESVRFIHLGVWIVSAILFGLCMPWTNQISQSTKSVTMGQMGVPCFALLPIGVQDLLRISMRQTGAKVLACLLLAIPTWSLLPLFAPIVSDHDYSYMPLRAVILIALQVIIIRPILVYARLCKVSDIRHIRYWFLLKALLVFLQSIWALAGIPLSFYLVVIWGISPETHSLKWMMTASPFLLALQFLAAHGVLRVYRWGLKRQMIELVHPLSVN